MDSRKKLICHEFQLGTCQDQFSCAFSHAYGPKVKGECEYGKVCSQVHNERDCEYFIKRVTCPRGSSCDYIHNWSLIFAEENNKEFGKNLRELNNDLSLFKEYEAKMNSKTTLDIAFIMDCTGSMQAWINACKNELSNIINLISEKFPGTQIRGGFVAYRDIGDNNRFQVKDFTKDIDDLKDFIGSITASGGGLTNDLCEDVAGGLEAGLNLSWGGKAKYAILIADYPNHGRKFSRLEKIEDEYPFGIPGAKPLSSLIKEYARKNIEFCAIRITNHTDLMFKKISKYYKAVTGVNIQIGDLRSSMNDFGFFVAGTASQSLSKQTALRDAKELLNHLKRNKQFAEDLLMENLKETPDIIKVVKTDVPALKPAKEVEKQLIMEKLKNQKKPKKNRLPIIQNEGPFPYNGNDSSEGGEDLNPSDTGCEKNAYQLYFEIPASQKSKYEAICHTVHIVNDRNCMIDWRKPCIKTHSIKTQIEMVNGYFGEGAMRYAYRLIDFRDNRLMVGKIQKDANEVKYSLEDMTKDVESQLVCQTLVHILNDRLISSIPEEIDALYNYADCLIYELKIEEPYNKFYWGENYIEGSYEKYNNNAGWENTTNKTSKSSLMAQCLSHFSWQYTKGYLIIVDVQGCSNVLTDPQIHCLDEKKFGCGNLGYLGMIKFFMSHRCNKYCKALNLLHPKEYDRQPKEFSFFLDKLTKPKNNYNLRKVCELCNNQFNIKSFAYFEKKKQFHEVYCNQCEFSIGAKLINKKCIRCDTEFKNSEYWFFAKKMEIPDLCIKCRREEREVERKNAENDIQSKE